MVASYGLPLTARRVWRAEEGDTDQDGDTPGAEADDSQSENSGTEVKLTPEQQALFDKALKARLARERKNLRAELEAEATSREEKAKQDAEKQRLAEQGEFKKLNETLTAEAEKAKTSLEAATGTVATLTQERDAYRAAVESMLTAQREGLPEHIAALLDKLNPLDQLTWIAENAEEVNKSRNGAAPGTPRTQRQRQPVPRTPGNSHGQQPAPERPLVKF
jgi:hypothetical protein